MRESSVYLFLKKNVQDMFDRIKLCQDKLALGQGTRFLSQVVR